MLRDVTYQLLSDEEAQKKIEKQVSVFLVAKHKKNLQALNLRYPELVQLIISHKFKSYYNLVNKNKHVNVLKVGNARCLYDINPEKQVNNQVDQFVANALHVNVESEETFFYDTPQIQGKSLNSLYPSMQQNCYSLNNSDDTLIIFGCSLGLHLLKLIKKHQWKKVLLVEPNFELLKISIFGADWVTFLNYIEANNIEFDILFNLVDNQVLEKVQEWVYSNKITSFCLFKHYDYVPFNLADFYLSTNQVKFKDLHRLKMDNIKNDTYFEFCYSASHFLHSASDENIKIKEQTLISSLEKQLDINAPVLDKFYPDLYQPFVNYKFNDWSIICMPDGSANLFNHTQGICLYQEDIIKNANDTLDHYEANPRIERLTDMTPSADKHAEYIHVKKALKLRELVKSLDLNNSPDAKLPRLIESFVLYGCGMGYQIERLLLNHNVRNFMLYEPNIEFFFLSYYLIKWNEIIDCVDKKEMNLFLNIGDDGSNLYEDLMMKFSRNTLANVLSNTYFHSSYYQANLDIYIRDARQNLNMGIVLAENFDSSYYNFSHTHENMRKNCPYMLADIPNTFFDMFSDTPIFILGNGPSIDSSIETIKKYKDKAILISCGSALKALYNAGIKPDFHAEIEQSIAPLAFIKQIKDPEWLKSINFISTGSVHPEITDVFNQSYLSVKAGDLFGAFYNSINNKLEHLNLLQHCFPTVFNCVLSFLSNLHFKQIYLFGIDLGYIDPDYHHGKNSAYYDANGKETYDHKNKVNTSLKRKGNFRSQVNTKYEYNLSNDRATILLAENPEMKCYNTSDGAYIEHTIPTKLEEINLDTDLDKANFLKCFNDLAFTKDITKLNKELIDFHNFDLFINQFNQLIDILKMPINTLQDVYDLLDKQDKFFLNVYLVEDSKFFVMLKSASTYFNTYLVRIAYFSQDENVVVPAFKEALSIWLDYINEAKAFCEEGMFKLDESYFDYIFEK